jgi:hypothetical protein
MLLATNSNNNSMTQLDKETLLKQLRQYKQIETRGDYCNRGPIISSEIKGLLQDVYKKVII